MILSGHQPCYLPGIQLFNKIALSDVFMFTGHCQYQRGEFHSHNFIRTCRLTVPVRTTFGDSIDNTRLTEGHWRRRHIKSIELAYSHFPFFDNYFPRLEQIINHAHSWLGTLNTALILQILDWLNIKTKILFSHDHKIQGNKEDMLISMCRAIGADEYLSNTGSLAYLGLEEEEKMKDAGITHRWQEFEHPFYGQETAMNEGRLSVIDLLFRRGPGARAIIERCGNIDFGKLGA